MRIAQLTATFPPYRGGAGNVAHEYARRLAGRGHDVEVFTADAPGTPPDSGGATVHRLKPLVAIGNAPLLPRLRLRGFDVIHFHHPFIFGTERALAAHARNGASALVVTHHNRLIGEGARKPLFWAYEETAGRALARRADHIAVLSYAHARSVNYLARELAHRPEQVSEVPNGVDVDAFQPGADSAGIRARHGIPPAATVALFVAALDRAHWFKRLDLAITAVARTPGVHLLVVGDGELRERHAREAQAAGVSERVHFAGAHPHDAMPDFLHAADLLVLPSELESFGLVLIEAMACGLPVVATRLPGPANVVRDGDTGLLVTPGDAGDLAARLQALVALGPEGRREMGAAARSDVGKRFAWPSVIDRLEAAYWAAVGVRSGDPNRNFSA